MKKISLVDGFILQMHLRRPQSALTRRIKFFFEFPFSVDKERHILQLCSVRKMNGQIQWFPLRSCRKNPEIYGFIIYPKGHSPVLYPNKHSYSLHDLFFPIPYEIPVFTLSLETCFVILLVLSWIHKTLTSAHCLHGKWCFNNSVSLWVPISHSWLPFQIPCELFPGSSPEILVQWDLGE